MKLSDMQLFRGLEEDDIFSLLSCLNSVKRNYKKGEVILSEGIYSGDEVAKKVHIVSESILRVPLITLK